MQHALRLLAAAAMVVVGLWVWLYAWDDADEALGPAATATGPATEGEYSLAAARAQIVQIKMEPDTSFLGAEDRAVVNKLIQAADLLSEIYFRQYYARNPEVKAELEAADIPNKALVQSMFKMNGGPWDTFAEHRPFFGSTPYPEGAGFYPVDMTRDEFAAWIAAHPGDREAFESLYTVIRRDGDKLVAVPYSVEYREWLEPAARLLQEAAGITKNASLKKFLGMRAEAFLTDDYYPSEMAWMDLTGPIEIVIGPYEVYSDGLYGYKAAFEAYVTLKNPAESEALASYKERLKDMEANLPAPDGYKNFKRKFESPIIVANQVRGGGDNVPGVQTIAFNLPNDERVREAKGAKKVMLKNVMDAKFERILSVMAPHVVAPEQQGLLDRKYFFLETLFHELSHSLGPGAIVKDGRETTVNAELKETYSAMEEGKADVMGAYNILFLMDEGDLPAAERYNLLTTYFVGLFRSVRFGLTEAHAQGAAFQLSYFRGAGAYAVEPGTGLLRIDFPALEVAIKNLVRDLVVIQGDGDYAAAKAFLDRHVVLDNAAKAVLGALQDVPVDIEPAYPDGI